MDNTEKLKQIENELDGFLSESNINWTRIAMLLNQVSIEELWKTENLKYKSYSQWLRTYARHIKREENYLWKIKKAGVLYNEYVSEQANNNIEVAPLSEVTTDMQTYELADKIAGNDKTLYCNLCDKIGDGTLKRKDLNERWKKVRRNRENSGIKATKTNGYKAYEEPAKDNAEEVRNLVKASDILDALSDNDFDWIVEHPSAIENKVAKWETAKTKLFPEFAVQTESSKKARRIDALVVTNKAIDPRFRPYKVDAHSVEIKVTKYDLQGDRKLNDYMPFVDFQWIAIPDDAEMIKIIEDEQLLDVGVLLYSENESQNEPTSNENKIDDKVLASDKKSLIKVYRDARRLEPDKKNEMLMTTILKMI